MDWVADLPGAASRGELVAFFQPQIDVASERIVAAEALCRWNHPTLGSVPPSEFIPAAEESGGIHEIGAFMLERACAFLRAESLAGIQIAVNVSAVQLAHPDFSSRVADTYQQYGVEAGRVTIELTESRPVLDIPDAVAHLQMLRDLGSGISIDDFGTGYSSSKQLDALPFTELKIDQSLIREDTEETWTRVATIVAVVRDKGMRIVAEGIETKEQYDRIRESGCDRAQGYFLGVPMGQAEFERFYADHQRTALPRLARRASRALSALGLRNLEDLAEQRRAEVLALPGIGRKTVSLLAAALTAAGLDFAE
jgi:EAL domain-containing protein (putative c-di-GMP-specific phosphodiesterase class I)